MGLESRGRSVVTGFTLLACLLFGRTGVTQPEIPTELASCIALRGGASDITAELAATACAPALLDELCREAIVTEGLDVEAINACRTYCEDAPWPLAVCQPEFELHATAWTEFLLAAIVQDHGIEFPQEAAAALRLPGPDQFELINGLDQTQLAALQTASILSTSLITSITVHSPGPIVSLPDAWRSDEPDAQSSLVVTIQSDGVLLNDKLVLVMTDFEIADAARLSASSPILPDVVRAVDAFIASHDLASRVATIAADQDTPYRVLTYVMMSASAGGIDTYLFAVTSASQQDQLGPTEDAIEQADAVPRLLLALDSDGLDISDMRQSEAFSASGLGDPVAGCATRTICLDRSDPQSFVEAFPWHHLYNRLIAIRDYPGWANLWEEDNLVVNIVASTDIPFLVIVRTMDVARYRLVEDSYDSAAELSAAEYAVPSAELFPFPVLLLPNAQ